MNCSRQWGWPHSNLAGRETRKWCDWKKHERPTDRWQTEAAFTAAHIRTSESESTGDTGFRGTHIEPCVPKILEREHEATSRTR